MPSFIAASSPERRRVYNEASAGAQPRGRSCYAEFHQGARIRLGGGPSMSCTFVLARPRAAVPTGIVLLAALLAGCAQSYQPIVDMKGVDEAQYQLDLSECRAYAEEVSPTSQAALGGAGGALLGGALG